MRSWTRALLGLAFAAAQAAPGRAASDLNTMQPPEIEALQKRLTDAGCYHGAIDGQMSAAIDTAVKACPDQAPVLRIETGMHTASINRIGVDAACQLMATGSDDKMVRLWSVPEGRQLRTVRLPIGDGRGGGIHAVALSPDGRTLAVGVWDAAWNKDPADSHGPYLSSHRSHEQRGLTPVLGGLIFSHAGTGGSCPNCG